MVRIKTLSMALVAVFVSSAVLASAASAEGIYTASSYPATATGTSALGNTTFTTEAGSEECKYHYEATLTGPSSNLTVKAQVSECKAFGFASATVNMGSCDWLYTTPTTVTAPHIWTAKVHTKCTDPTKPITITSGSCEVMIGEQSPEGHVIITTTTTVPQDLDLKGTLTGITYTVTKDGFLCPFGGTGKKTGATYTTHEEITFKSTVAGQGIDVIHLL